MDSISLEKYKREYGFIGGPAGCEVLIKVETESSDYQKEPDPGEQPVEDLIIEPVKGNISGADSPSQSGPGTSSDANDGGYTIGYHFEYPDGFACNYCEFVGSTKYQLRKHISTTHSTARYYNCPHCQYSTTHGSHLKQHIRNIHTREKPFSCPHCDYSATNKGDLKRHIVNIHTEDKLFTCALCDYSTSISHNLKRHFLSVHSKDKPFTCDFCEYSTSTNNNLKRHVMTKHMK